MSGWTYLFLAILSEVLASSALKASQGFSRLLPSLVVVGGYGLAFYFLSLALKTVPLSLAYAVWAGVGTAAIALIGAFFFWEAISPKGWLGIALVAVGVVLIRLAD